MIDRCGQHNVEYWLSASRVREFNNPSLNLVTIVHQENLTTRQLRASHDYGVCRGSDNAQIGTSLDVDRTAGKVQVRRGPHGNIQLHVVEQIAGAGGALGASLELAGQSRQIEVLSEAETVNGNFTVQRGSTTVANQIESAIEDYSHCILVANAHALCIELLDAGA